MKNLNTAFPFYDALDEQVRYKPYCDAFPLIVCPPDGFVPFIIRRDHSAGTTADLAVRIFNGLDVEADEVTADDLGITIETGTTYDYLIYAGRALDVPLDPHPKGYYLDIVDTFPGTPKHWYSEIFNFRESVTDLLKLHYYNVTQLNNIFGGFEQIIYFDEPVKLNAPEYPREDVGDKRDGLIVREKQILIKQHMLRLWGIPEYLVDALMLVPMMDTVDATQDGVTYTYKQVTAKDPEFIDQSFALMANLELQFIIDVTVKKLNFKENGYTGDDLMAIIKQGAGQTVTDGDHYSLTVTFEDPMPTVPYTPQVTAFATGTADSQLASFENLTVNGFDIITAVECDVYWTAILVES